jgi:uncharacterized membrane protein YphA (DoxX/SURF4 family)
MADSTIVGKQPWLPPPLATSKWWTVPVAAERLAAVRIGVGLTLVGDVLGTYLPRSGDLFGAGSVTQASDVPSPASLVHRLLLSPLADAQLWQALLLLWALSGVLLAAGVLTRWAAAFAWYVSASSVAINPWLHNAGDQVRTILLLLLVVAPSDAVWSVLKTRPKTPTLIYPWPLNLLAVQMAAIYFMNGLFKAFGADWRTGQASATILGDTGWIRFPLASLGIPRIALQLSDWLVVLWELGFPFFMLHPRLRTATLVFGVLFHVVTAITMRVGMFPAYMLCLYLMFIPWEKWRQ